jgi:hypothetical protein
MSNQYGKFTLVSGQKIVQDVGGSGLSGIVIGNESGLTCTVALVGANVRKTLYPGTVDKFEVPSGKNWNGNVEIIPSADLNNIISWPSSHIYIDTYGIGEHITGQYPMVLNRTGNIGNAVNFVAGSSTSVQNDNNATGTSVVEATTLGSPTSNVSIDNSGTGWIGRWNNPTFTKIFQWFLAGGTAIKLAATGLLTEVLGGLTVDQNLTVIGSSSLDNGTLTSDGAGNLSSNSLATNTVNVGTVNATTANVTTLNATGDINPLGNIILENNTPLKIEDAADTARNVLNVDASNITTLFGITGKDQVNVSNAAGTVKIIMDLVLGLLTIPGTKQTLTGNTSGTYDIYEYLGGGAGTLKCVLCVQNNYRDTTAFKQVTLKSAFTVMALILNGGCGGIATGTAGVIDTGSQQITWGAGGAAGSQNTVGAVGADAAGFALAGFTQMGNNNYGSAHTGIALVIGV